MNSSLWWRVSRIALACLVVLSIGACATAKHDEGGIVGTGNNVDCERVAKKNGSALPEECKSAAKP
jgi:hypothetical protein